MDDGLVSSVRGSIAIGPLVCHDCIIADGSALNVGAQAAACRATADRRVITSMTGTTTSAAPSRPSAA
jgi:hypothetical protein